MGTTHTHIYNIGSLVSSLRVKGTWPIGACLAVMGEVLIIETATFVWSSRWASLVGHEKRDGRRQRIGIT